MRGGGGFDDNRGQGQRIYQAEASVPKRLVLPWPCTALCSHVYRKKKHYVNFFPGTAKQFNEQIEQLARGGIFDLDIADFCMNVAADCFNAVSLRCTRLV